MGGFNYESDPAQIMRAIVGKHGKQIFLIRNKERLRKAIGDSYGKHKELMDILLKAADFGIPAELLRLDNDNRREQRFHRPQVRPQHMRCP